MLHSLKALIPVLGLISDCFNCLSFLLHNLSSANELTTSSFVE